MQKLIALFGIVVFLLIAWLFSHNKKAVNYKIIITALLFEFLVGSVIFLAPKSRDVLLAFSHLFTKIIDAAREGIVFVFGSLGAADSAQAGASGGCRSCPAACRESGSREHPSRRRRCCKQ